MCIRDSCYDDNGNKKTTGLKIYCYSNTQAEAYAKSGKFSYVLLDKLPAFAKVTGFKVKSKTNISANLQWDKNTSASGYELQKYNGSNWETIKTFKMCIRDRAIAYRTVLPLSGIVLLISA